MKPFGSLSSEGLYPINLSLGPRFVLRDFRTVVVENGSVPLTELEATVDAWIERGGGVP
jgi:hypothetical protein